MYDQDAVRQAIFEAGRTPGPLDLEAGVAEGNAAVHIQIDGHQAFFTPSETISLLYDLMERAEHHGYLDEDATVYWFAQLYDFSRVVDNSSDVTRDEVNHKWSCINPKRYNFDEDPRELRKAYEHVGNRIAERS